MKRIAFKFRAEGRRALTFGEMLVVLAVFSILATMFILSSRYAIEKSKYSRVLQEQRSVVAALDNYMLVNSGGIPSETQGLSALLTSRNPYLATLPTDLFRSATSDIPKPLYAYLSDDQHALIVSAGPDGDIDTEAGIDKLRKESVGLAGAKKILFKSGEEARQFIAKYSYDPTNGSGSDGDVITLYSSMGY